MISLVALGLAVSQPSAGMESIDVPYQIIPAFRVYVDCVADRLDADPRVTSDDHAAMRQANVDAIAACREVRARQLGRALLLQTDYRPYGTSANARAAVRRAFDRFDTDFRIEAPPPPPAEAPKGQRC